MLESPGASQKLIGEGLEDFVRTRQADALSPDTRTVILERTNALSGVNS